PSSRSLDDGNNPAHHLKRPHQPGASRRDPARPALLSRRNTQVPANAHTHALRQDRDKSSEIRVRPDPDPEAAWRKTSLTTSPPAASPPRSCHHHARPKTEIPIDRRRTPAGSCLGGFRTPDGIRKPSPWRSIRSAATVLESGHKTHRNCPGNRCRLTPTAVPR